ncbi:MAG: hypothetical protein ACI865_002892 [Flavobacteriaceae bacterium]|jgi:hypothetical protein
MKMTQFLVFASAALIIVSCGDTEPITEEVVAIEGVVAEIPEEDLFEYDALAGMYIGDFGGSDIRIIVSYVSQTNAVGYNIHRGLQRNLSGRVSRNGDSAVVALAEPGDHKFDGVFELVFIGDDPEPKGTWISNSGKIPEQSFNLKKMDASEAGYPEDGTKISESNLHQFFSDASDTLGEYSFKSDGLVIFSYYPGGYSYEFDEEENGNSVNQQLTSIQGSWSLSGNKVTVSWEKNAILAQSQMVYTINQEEYEAQLLYKDNPIYMRMYP